MNRTEYRGLVLSMTPYKERDGILKVLTRQGIRSLFARGVQTQTSKNRRLCNPYSIVDFDVDEREEGMDRLIRGDVVSYADAILDDLQKQAVMQVLNDCLLRTNPDGTLYDGLEHVWKAAQNDGPWLALACFLLAHALKLEGIAPYVDGCVICQNPVVTTFSKEQAGFLCTEHKGVLPNWKKAELQKIRALFKAGPDKWASLAPRYAWTEHDFLFLAEWFTYYSHLELTSLRFLKQVAALL